ncbi:MAG: efflux RND transporter periplasmic adaptor subunit [Flavobacteriales bacterium]|nr:efflux RND transporter periplasmic adaptor subunit [Flavobacteriales bacterium]
MRNSLSISALAISFVLLLSACSEDRMSYTVKREKIVEAVYSSISIEADETYTVTSVVSGYIEEFAVEIGDSVTIGQELFKVRDVQASASSSNAELAYEMARRNLSGDLSLLEDIRLNIEDAFLKRRNDSINHERNKALFNKELLTEVEFEQSELVFQRSKNAHIALVKKLHRTEKELKTSLSQARNNFASSASRNQDAAVRSKIDGMVYDIMKEDGEFAAMQEPIAIVGSSTDFKIMMLIDEVDVVRIKRGQKIYVSLEAYPNSTFEAHVTKVNPKMDTRTQTFEVEGEFDVAPESLYMGLTGEGNIVIDERENVLTIPREFLIGNNKVETEEGQVKVKVGAKSLSHVEILEGLKEGQVIFKPE